MENKNEIQNGQYRTTGCKIIPFPRVNPAEAYSSQVTYSKKLNDKVINEKVILGRPGEKLPDSIPDFRPHLQRNGLLLLSWDKRLYRKGALYTAYWVTSAGIHRYYASQALHIENFPQAMPDRKSYAAEDGIDYYGEAGPLYIVHVAPELMMSSQVKKMQRPEHIKKLKALGVQADFTYSYILTREKKRQYLDNFRGA
ncbi:MAG: hypothetical protein FWD78_13150 [Treponema sp.]|nr:hypothetical protein [Treponema sp.]